MYAAIGELIALWALQEWMIAGCICLLLGIDRKQGRIAIGNPRAADSVERIKQLLDVKGLTVTTDLAGLKGLLTEGEKSRDLLGHGIWIVPTDTGVLSVQDLKGNWNLGKEEKSLRKLIYPAANALDLTWFTNKREAMEKSIVATDTLYREIEAVMS